MAKSKFFRVAVEGATTDGRNIERSWLTEMAATYDRAKYGARIFIEHIRGLNPEWGFRAMGDVLALKAEEIAEGPLKGKMGLYAQIQPTDEMVKLVNSGQKIYSSMEINPNFAETNKKYLDGLGITDSPASLGTEVLTFAAQHPDASPFKARKHQPGNLFSVAEPVDIEWEDEPADTTATALFAAVKAKLAKLSGKGKAHDGQFAEVAEALQSVSDTLEHFAADNKAVSQRFADQVTALTARLDALDAAGKKAAEDFTALRAELESTSATPKRPPATGGGDNQLTDC
jgi:hypothetical protein